METLLYIICGILTVWCVFLNIVVILMRRSLKKRWQKGKLYLSDEGCYCEFHIPMEEIETLDVITLKVVDTKKKNGGVQHDN